MVGIIYVGNINRCPYLKHYTDCLDRIGLDYEIIYWNRSSKKDNGNLEKNKVVHVFEYPSKEQRPPYTKLIDFYKFGKFARKIIKEKNYEKLVVLTTMTGILLLKELCGKYKKKYIFDYRDASYEYIKPFYMLLSRIIDNSAFTCISSRGFLKILPNNKKYIMAHNISSFEVSEQYDISRKDKYVVGYIGGLRSSNYMKMLVDIFANDKRFDFIVHGGGDNYNEMVCYSDHFDNVKFTGFYDEKNKEQLIKEIDIICYNYPESFNNNIALANKYYDALVHRKPLLGNINTYSGKLIENNGIGISLDFKDHEYKTKLYNYLNNFDYIEFNKKCDVLLKEIMKEHNIYINKIEEFFTE